MIALTSGYVRRFTASAPLMLAYSNMARAGSYILPVPLIYARLGAGEAAFWLLATTLIGLQNLLFLGAPQILIRMLAVARAVEDDHAQPGTSRVPTTQELQTLMRYLFWGASILITIVMATAGSYFVAKVINASQDRIGLWMSWGVIVLSSPIRISTLRNLTYLNGRGDMAFPRLVDGTAWGLSGVLAVASLALSGSMLVMVICAQLPILISLVVLGLRSRQQGWRWSGSENVRATFGAIWPPTWRAGLGVLLSTGVRQGAGVYLAAYAAPTTLAGFLLAQNVISVIMMLSSAPIQSSVFAMSHSYARNDTREHVRVAQIAMSRSLWVTTALCGGVCLAIPSLGMLHISHTFVPVYLWSVLAVSLFLQRYGAAHLQHYSITNHIIWHWLDGCTGLVNLALCYFWIPRYAAYGAAYANLVSLLLVYCWVPTVIAVRRFEIKWPDFDLRAAALPAVALGVILFGSSYL